MAEQRQKLRSVLLRVGSNDRKGRPLDIFPAEQWPDQPEADIGLYRVRLDGRWVCASGQQYTFFTPEALGRLIAEELTAPGALEALERPAPDLRRGDHVLWRGWDGVLERTKLMSDPMVWVDGQWRAWIMYYHHGLVLVCCDELKPVDRFGREVRP